MNKVMKKLLCACLALAMLITVIPPVTAAQAATKTEKMILYKGEVYSVSLLLGKLKSVSSNKKSVASVKKDSGKAIITAKKTGKATVTLKTNRGNFKYVVTVKKFDVTAKLSDMGNGYMLLTVKNNTKQTLTSIDVDYKIVDDQGNTKKTDKKMVSDVVAGKTVYTTVTYDSYNYSVDETKCTAKASPYSGYGGGRSASVKYKNVGSSIETTVDEDTSEADTVKLTIQSKNKQKKDSASVDYYVLIYNSMDQVIGMRIVPFYLKAGKMDTRDLKIDTKYVYKDYARYKVVTVAYSTI